MPCAVLTPLHRSDNLACVMPGSPLKAQVGSRTEGGVFRIGRPQGIASRQCGDPLIRLRLWRKFCESDRVAVRQLCFFAPAPSALLRRGTSRKSVNQIRIIIVWAGEMVYRCSER